MKIQLNEGRAVKIHLDSLYYVPSAEIWADLKTRGFEFYPYDILVRDWKWAYWGNNHNGLVF